MTTWKVEKANTPIPDTVEAERFRVHHNGELEFYNNRPHPEWSATVKLYAPGRWLEVTLEGHVCESLPRHVHNGEGEPVYVDAP